ncbi:MAG TPA: hypothetical protein VLI93_16360, partial [Acetobacteraceae bacterium]|nr:hypothetical protein [Acetobacteraceae bacterium]
MLYRSRQSLRTTLWILFVVLASLGHADAHGAGADQVHFAVPHAKPGVPALLGYLRQPAGDGPFAAVVLLHGCGGGADKLDRTWGARLQDWGYVAVTVDSFGPRGITTACNVSPDRQLDAYGALRLLAKNPAVDSNRIAVMGF